MAAISILKDLILEAMREVTSADKAYRLLIEWGYKFSRQSVRQSWREVGEETGWKIVLNTWGWERTPPRFWARPGTPWMTSPWQQIISFKGRDIETGESFIWPISMAVEKLRPFASILEEIQPEVEESMKARGYIITGVEIEGIVQKP